MKPIDAALKWAAHGFNVFPLKPNSKLPAVKWGHEYSNDPEVILRWERELGPDLNWGIPTGWRNGIIVLDLDSPEAEEWWASQWLPLGTVVTTPRGGRHVYYAYDGDIEFQTNQSKLLAKVDVRADGGFVVAPGSKTSSAVNPAYGDGTYEGDLSSIVEAPAELLDMLPVRTRQAYNVEPPSGPQVESASPGEERAIAYSIETLEAIQRPWVEGAMWDETTFRVACRLSRMVNSPEYALNEEQAISILLTHGPHDEVWGDEEILAKWESAKRQTEGQYAATPSDAPNFTDIEKVIDLIPDARWERFYWEGKDRADLREFAKALRDSGVGIEDAYTLVWHAKANEPAEPGGKRQGVWRTVKQVFDNTPELVIVMDDVEPPAPSETRKRLTILSDEEREILDRVPNFIDKYLFVARQRFGVINEEYHTVSAWSILSNVFGDAGYIASRRGRLLLNVWTQVLGPSASGKGDALKLWRETINRALPEGMSSISVGSSATDSSLHRLLLERDNKVSLMYTDEAAGLYKLMHNDRSFGAGLREFITLAYDGIVGGMARQNDKDRGLHDKSAERAVFNMWLTGTWDGVVGEMTYDDVSSGFLGRFIYGVGERSFVTHDSLRPEIASDTEITLGVHPLVKSLSESLRKHYINFANQFLPIGLTDDAAELIHRARIELDGASRHVEMEKDAVSISIRMGENAWKCAALHALSEGRTTVEYTDALVAVRAMEGWAGNMFKIIGEIEAAGWRRLAEEIYRFLIKKGGAMSRDLYLHFSKQHTREIDDAMSRLLSEGRVTRSEKGGGGKWMPVGV